MGDRKTGDGGGGETGMGIGRGRGTGTGTGWDAMLLGRSRECGVSNVQNTTLPPQVFLRHVYLLP